ncbi:hypothetical protein O6H91_19G008400 [Diphasiastrum complanatum]|uniref:Uncharacterized protein n=1 Tax=Diphasiastrum complanatum TaxID=34168 RepID=A0ACC2ASQ6_DIPCM|nr:hypothetical protein O6H91_19G008400 [Diphasiastrum complanatum]
MSAVVASSMTLCSAAQTSKVLFSQLLPAAGGNSLNRDAALRSRRCSGKPPCRAQPMMKNINEGKGVFAPLVVVARNILGAKRFNQIRGKGIALHSQVITEFCKSIGADAKQRQGLIRLAKKNGEKLGFLA